MAENKKATKDEPPKDTKGGKGAEEKDAAVEGAEGAEAAASGRKFTPKKIVLFVVLPLLLLIALGGGAYFMGFLDSFLPAKPLDCTNVKEGDKDFAACAIELEALGAGKPGAFLSVPDMIVNLNGTGKQTRFLKVSLKMELESDLDQKKIEPLLPRVVDQFQMYLRELRLEDLRGTSGIYRMKIELLNRVRAAAPTVKVRDVLFQEILVQ